MIVGDVARILVRSETHARSPYLLGHCSEYRTAETGRAQTRQRSQRACIMASSSPSGDHELAIAIAQAESAVSLKRQRGSEVSKEPCKFGSKCYRKNAQVGV